MSRSRSTSRSRVTVAVFARAPLPGRTKSRLIPRLGPWGASRLHERLLARALEAALASGARVELHGFPKARQASLLNLARKYRIALVQQRGSDLGERMYHALAKGLRRSRAVIAIGSDIPALRSAQIAQAARFLAAGRDAVLAPAEDGGYALIGLRRLSRSLFREIEWGGSDVYRRTAKALDRLGYRWQALEQVWDIDRPEDLDRFRALRLRRSFSADRRGARR